MGAMDPLIDTRVDLGNGVTADEVVTAISPDDDEPTPDVEDDDRLIHDGPYPPAPPTVDGELITKRLQD